MKTNVMLFLAHLTIGRVNFCHHLASFICLPSVICHKLFKFKSSPLKPQNQLKPIWRDGPFSKLCPTTVPFIQDDNYY